MELQYQCETFLIIADLRRTTKNTVADIAKVSANSRLLSLDGLETACADVGRLGHSSALRDARSNENGHLKPGSRPGGGASASTMEAVSAQPVEHHDPQDPRDPQRILTGLPERERAEFLRQYREAVDAAHDPVGYKNLQRILRVWSLAVIATNRPGYYQAIQDAKDGIGASYPLDEAIAAELARRS
jgi:hypothetical protein